MMSFALEFLVLPLFVAIIGTWVSPYVITFCQGRAGDFRQRLQARRVAEAIYFLRLKRRGELVYLLIKETALHLSLLVVTSTILILNLVFVSSSRYPKLLLGLPDLMGVEPKFIIVAIEFALASFLWFVTLTSASLARRIMRVALADHDGPSSWNTASDAEATRTEPLK